MSLKQLLCESKDLSLGIALAVPALLVYELGVLVLGPSVRNGAQLLLKELFLQIGPVGVHILNGLLIAGATVSIVDAYQRYGHLFMRWVLVGLESLVYAAILGPVILLLEFPLADLLRMAGSQEGPGRLIVERVVLAFGAGVYEELFFRLLILSAVYHVVYGLLHELRWLAVVIALLVSSLFFSLCHHDLILAGGDPFTWQVFLFRTLAGILLGLVFAFRGFAAAVYTHAFYNLIVFFR